MRVFLVLFLLFSLSTNNIAFAEEYAVPHSGSPYLPLNDLKNGEILHLPTGLKVNFDQMQNAISSSRVIYIGETHDNIEAHRAQLEIIEDLAKRFPGKISVGMEMFRRSAQQNLNQWNKGELSSGQFKNLFRKNWGNGYALYKSIFEFLNKNHIPLIGLKSSKKTEDTFRGNDQPGQNDLPKIDFNDRYHRPFSMSIFGGHQAMEQPYRMLLLWEETMAQTVADFLKNPSNINSKLVILAGGFHVQYGFGIPKRAFRRVPHSYSIVLPTVTELPPELKDREMDVKHVSIPLYSADYAWKIQYKVLPENKVKLGVLLENSENTVRIKSVSANSNAELAGLKDGDLLLAIDGIKLIDIEDLTDKLKRLVIGDRARLIVKRGLEEMDIEIQFMEPNQ
ncbi:MAG: ChaN family lipoprotein [Nitrospinaceae bacterium]|nr:ChaN family lipoprotein [Nitrospinaceae bacterium]